MVGFRHRSMPALGHTRGFTLLETMITIIIAALLVALALPSFRELSMRNTATTLSNQLVLALRTARAEAIRRGTWVEVLSLNNNNNWGAMGWQVVADVDFDHVLSPGSGDLAGVITAGAKAPTGYTVCSKASTPTGIGGDLRVVFGPSGTLTQSSSFDFNVNRPDGNSTMVQHILVSGSGEVTSYRGKPSGAPTSC